MICPYCSCWVEPVPEPLRMRGYDRVIWPLRQARAALIRRVVEDAALHHRGGCIIKHQRDKEKTP